MATSPSSSAVRGSGKFQMQGPGSTGAVLRRLGIVDVTATIESHRGYVHSHTRRGEVGRSAVVNGAFLATERLRHRHRWALVHDDPVGPHRLNPIARPLAGQQVGIGERQDTQRLREDLALRIAGPEPSESVRHARGRIG